MSGKAEEEKSRNDPEHFEGYLKQDNGAILKSDHDKLGVWATVWRFKKVSHNPLSRIPFSDRPTQLFSRQFWCVTCSA